MEINLPDSKEQELEHLIGLKIAEIAAVAEDLPGVVIVHNLRKDLSVEYISPRGEQKLGHTLEEIKQLGSNYNMKFFNQEDAKEYIPKIINMIEQNNDEIVTFFQQVRASEDQPWAWYLSTAKILLWDREGAPVLVITMAYPIDPLHHVTSKVSRLLEENNFLRQNYNKFSQLTKREQEVLKLMALGKSAAETATELHISITTVETHRRNIKQKLDTNSFFELTKYAFAFDLI